MDLLLFKYGVMDHVLWFMYVWFVYAHFEESMDFTENVAIGCWDSMGEFMLGFSYSPSGLIVDEYSELFLFYV